MVNVQNELIEREESLSLKTIDQLERYFLDPESRDEGSLEVLDRNLKFRDQSIRRRSGRAREAICMIRAMELGGVKTSAESINGVLRHIGIDGMVSVVAEIGEGSGDVEKPGSARKGDETAKKKGS